MSRRANGEGSLSRRKDGRWEGAAYVLIAGGDVVRKRVYGRTRAEAANKLALLMKSSRDNIPAVSAATTVGEYLTQWLRVVAGESLRPSTVRGYEMYVRVHLVPGLGRKKLTRLSPTDLREFLALKRRAGLSDATVKQLHAILRSALQHALREELVTRNVAKLVRVPTSAPKEVVPLTAAEAQQLLAAAEGTRLHALWVVALTTGLRRAELLGLRWCDIDLDAGTLRVVQTLQREQGQLMFVPPKSARSRRTLCLPTLAIEALTRHRKRAAEEALRRGCSIEASGLAFTSTVGTPVEPRNADRVFVELLEKAGLRRVRLHDLRHTCASLLLAQGVSPRVVMETLGHSGIGITMNTYAHVMPVMQREAASRMDDALGRWKQSAT